MEKMNIMNMTNLSVLEKNIVNAQGDLGRKWFNSLPLIIEDIQRQWGLTEVHPIANMNWNFVAIAKKNDSQVVLKISADATAIFNEFQALSQFSGFGAIEVIHYNSDLNALLLQHANPGTTLKQLYAENTNTVIQVYAELLKKMSLSNHSHACLPHIKEWCNVIDEMSDPRITKDYIIKAKEIRHWIFQTISHEYVCHGDLHLENILKNKNNWLVIDPKGIIGEMAFEASAFDLLNENEADSKDAKNIIRARIQLLSDAIGVENYRLTAWIFLRIMLSIQWFIEDNGSPERMLKMANHVYALLE